MSIKSVVISYVEPEYNAEYIANVFWRQNIAKVNSIVLIPYSKNGVSFQMAYVSIEQWAETESAYNFLQRLKTRNDKETRIIHRDDSWWTVEGYKHSLGPHEYTHQQLTTFNDSFYEKECFVPSPYVTLRPHQRHFAVTC